MSVYFGLFDDAMPEGFREDRERYAESIAERLRVFGKVLFPGLVDTDEAGRRLGEEFADSVDVVVFAPSMAAPPSYAWACLEQLHDIPLVAVAGQEGSFVPDEYDTEQATRRSLPVGFVMSTNVFVREGRPFTSVVGVLGDQAFEDRLARAMHGAMGAAAVRGSRLGALGAPIAGYLDVEASVAELSSLGVEVVEVGRELLSRRYSQVGDGAVSHEMKVDRGRFEAEAVDEQILERSARLVCALREICEEEGLDGGAVNCHGDHFRWNPEVGVTACLAVSRLSEDGRPFSCTGDLPIAIALVLGKAVAGAALYCELYQLDVDHNWILVANGGEGDIDVSDPDLPVRLLPEDHYMGDRGPGTAVAFGLKPGAATLISLSPIRSAAGGWRLAVAEGSILGSRHHLMEGPNGMFRFDQSPVDEAYRRWCEAGATHHAALLPGSWGEALSAAARLLGIESAMISTSVPLD